MAHPTHRRLRIERRAYPALLTLLLAACSPGSPVVGAPSEASSPDQVPRAPSYASARIDGVPHVRQKPDFCGEAAAAAFLGKLGKTWDQDQVFAVSGMDPARGMGATTRELSAALRSIGFEVGPTWYEVPAIEAGVELEQQFAALHADLARGVPSIVCTRFDERPHTAEHFRLVLGYDQASDEVIYHDPAIEGGAYMRMKRARLMSLWPLHYSARPRAPGAPEQWTVIRMPLVAGEIAEPPRFVDFSPADYAQHVMRLRARLQRGPEKLSGFTVVLEPPFVVVGDEAPDVVKRRAAGTVRWAVEHLKQDFFSKNPTRILEVWLLSEKESYEHHARAVFGDEPSTPYGYYSAEHGALIMNIATGGGTLVHEIVHPFMEANFPDAPAWLNEGLGSLYEQSAEEDGHIVGLTNWRLAGLQRAIREGRLPSFASLTKTSSREFYGDDSGTNYAQARYLLYYLQEHGLLLRFFHDMRAAHSSDPTGHATLQRVLGVDDMRVFQPHWQRWVLALRFP